MSDQQTNPAEERAEKLLRETTEAFNEHSRLKEENDRKFQAVAASSLFDQDTDGFAEGEFLLSLVQARIESEKAIGRKLDEYLEKTGKSPDDIEHQRVMGGLIARIATPGLIERVFQGEQGSIFRLA